MELLSREMLLWILINMYALGFVDDGDHTVGETGIYLSAGIHERVLQYYFCGVGHSGSPKFAFSDLSRSPQTCGDKPENMNFAEPEC